MRQPIDEFWHYSLREYLLITDAARNSLERDIKSRRVLNQELAHLVVYSFHDPQKMPDFTKEDGDGAAEMSPDASRAHLHALFVSMHYGQKGA